MQINLNQSNVNPSDLVAWVHKGYMYCPVLTVGDQIFSHEIVDMSDPDKEPLFYEAVFKNLWIVIRLLIL